MRDTKVKFSTDNILIENFIENEKEDFESARLHYLLSASEFLRYDLEQEVSLVFSWQDFYYVVDLAQQLRCDLRIQFKKPGKPIVISIDTGTNFTIQTTEITLSNISIEKKQRNDRDISYKDYAKKFYKGKNIEITYSELTGVASPEIYVTDNQQLLISQNMDPNVSNKRRSDKISITDNDMDGMIAAATNNQSKRPRIESNPMPDADLDVQDDEQAKLEHFLRELDNLTEMDVDAGPLTLMRPTCPESQETISQQSHRKRFNSSAEFGPTPPSAFNDTIVNMDTELSSSEELDFAEKEKMRKLKRLFTPAKSEVRPDAYQICSGSGSDSDD